MHRTQAFISHGSIIERTVTIERELGVTRVGRSGYTSPTQLTSSMKKDLRLRAEDFTVRINTLSTTILFTAQSPEWNSKCSQFSLGLLKQIEPCLPDRYEIHHELKELLEHNIVSAEVSSAAISSIRERMTLQLNVLWNFVAQVDNALNASLAAAAGRDSTSMKILAFIAALFLPGSFVAGIFSMSMFNWQYSEGRTDGQSPGGAVVSTRFWLYWAIAVPLTLATLMGWGVWWRVEMRRNPWRVGLGAQ